MISTFRKLQDIIGQMNDDIERFYKKENKSAGRRVRKNLQEAKKLAQDIRMDILKKSSRQTRTRRVVKRRTRK